MSDTFRIEYTSLLQEDADLILMIKIKAEELEQEMVLVSNREMSLALTNLEQSVMWATKAIYLASEKKLRIK